MSREKPDRGTNRSTNRRFDVGLFAYWMAIIGPLSLVIRAIGLTPDSLRGAIYPMLKLAWIVAGIGAAGGLIGIALWCGEGVRGGRTRAGRLGRAAGIVGLLGGAASFGGAGIIDAVRESIRLVSEKPRLSSCTSNLKQLMMGELMYSQDYDQHLPQADAWVSEIEPYTKNRSILHCPEETEQTVPSYGMNRAASGERSDRVEWPPDLVVLFDSKPGRTPAGGPELLPNRPRHGEADVYGFLDGHVYPWKRGRLPAADWAPRIWYGEPGPNRPSQGR